MSKLFSPKGWKVAAGVSLLGGAAIVAAIVTISPPLASMQDVALTCPLRQEGMPKPPTSKELGELKVWDEPCDLPEVTWKSESGEPVTPADYRGKTVLLNLWATWCVPCIKEMPALDRLQAEMGGPAFEVVAVSQDREGAKVARQWIDKNNITNLAVHADPNGSLGRALKAPGLPVTLILDPQGREIARLMGEAEWDSPEMQERLQNLAGTSG